MSSHSKPNINTQRKADIDTTLSANLMGKSKRNQQQKPKISAFNLQNSEECHDLLTGESKQLKAVKDINYQYIELFHNIFKDNKQLLKLFYMNSQILTNPLTKLTKQQRYQLQCMKLFQNTCQQIQKMNKIRHINQQWKTITDYVNSKITPQRQVSRQQFLKMAKQLISTYKQTNQKLIFVQQEHKQILERNINNIQHLQNKQQNKLTKMEKQFKKTQKKLNKVMNEQLYYQQKCTYQQKLSQQLRQKVKRIEQSKLSIEMKIISDKSRNDRLIRKNKQRKDKSFAPSQQKQINPRAVRSKSSTRITQYNKNNQYSQFVPAQKLNYF